MAALQIQCPECSGSMVAGDLGRSTCPHCDHTPGVRLNVIDGLIIDGWEFAIEWASNQFTIIVWKPEWITNNLAQSVPLPTGEGETLEAAWRDLIEGQE